MKTFSLLVSTSVSRASDTARDCFNFISTAQYNTSEECKKRVSEFFRHHAIDLYLSEREDREGAKSVTFRRSCSKKKEICRGKCKVYFVFKKSEERGVHAQQHISGAVYGGRVEGRSPSLGRNDRGGRLSLTLSLSLFFFHSFSLSAPPSLFLSLLLSFFISVFSPSSFFISPCLSLVLSCG